MSNMSPTSNLFVKLSSRRHRAVVNVSCPVQLFVPRMMTMSFQNPDRRDLLAQFAANLSDYFWCIIVNVYERVYIYI